MALRTSDVAKAAGVNIETLRFYERRGLLPAPRRTRSGYRQYTTDAVRIVTFVKRAQELGFSLREAKALLTLRSAQPTRGLEVRKVVQTKLRDIDERIRDLTAMRGALSSLVATCECCDEPSRCPILEALERK